MDTIDKLTVQDLSLLEPVCVSPMQSVIEVAQIFETQRVHSVIVVNELGKCTGIFTSHDLCCYVAQSMEVNERIDHGDRFELAADEESGVLHLELQQYDEVQRHMKTALQTVDLTTPLMQAAMIMEREKIHHLVVVDDSQRPVGVVSSLDLIRPMAAQYDQSANPH